MKKITSHLFIIYLACTFVSCIAPAPPLEVPPGESKLVINGTFTNDENFQVVLYKIRTGSEEVLYVENAEVRILSEDNELLETLTSFPANEKSNVPCYGSVDLKAEVGKLYKINVKAPNFPDSTTAESIIPLPSGVAAGSYNTSNTVDVPDLAKGMFLQVEIEDADVLERNYFHLNFYHLVKVDLNNDGLVDPMGDPMRMNKFSPNDPGSLFVENRGVLLTDRSFPYPVTKKRFIYKVEFEEEILAALANKDNYGSIRVELRTVSESYYNFLTSKIGQNNSNFNPFLNSDPEYTNVLNGLGLFSGFSTKTDTIVIRR